MFVHVDALRILARVALGESQIVFEHLLHFINVPLQRLDLGARIMASCSRKRVRIVCKSWLTPASMIVRCST